MAKSQKKGLDAIRAAEAMADAGTYIHVRTTAARKALYVAAAKTAKLDLSKLVIKLLDEYLER